jgi:electron transport complex protein RnfD
MMPSTTASSPFLRQAASVRRVMLTVVVALVPAIAVWVWLFGAGILLTLAIASVTALAAEALMLRLRGLPVMPALGDGSALLTAWLLALCLSPLSPWWLVAVATLFAIVVAKHLYGGLGQNPFNPAMVGFAVCIVSFPALMSQWPTAAVDSATQVAWILGAERVDGVTQATPLDHLKTGLRLAEGGADVGAIRSDESIHGHFGGRGWEWVALAYLLGGIFLLARRVITWQVPLAYLGTVALLSGLLWLWRPAEFASPLFHLLAGGTMLAAFFIATDPVSGATTPRGKLVFGFGAGLLTIVIRLWGGYPDGVAFAILLLNLCVPLIDMYTQPPVFGARPGEESR